MRRPGKLPPGYPRKWPNPSAEDLAALEHRLVYLNQPQKFSFASNFVRTSKYTLLTFLPRFLLEVFHPRKKAANVYFLCIAGLQCIREISNTFGIPTMLLPLSFVICVDAVFAVLEDITKHKADAKANATEAEVLREGVRTSVTWADIVVGDIVIVRNWETVPADVLLLCAHEANASTPEGVCYIETKSLDGETNLKMRKMCDATHRLSLEEVVSAKGFVCMEHPNSRVHDFQGTLELEKSGPKALDAKNICLRGVTLRNTEWVAGLVVNTGVDTKIMMSSAERPAKQSRLERMVNSQLAYIVLILVAASSIGAAGYAIFSKVYLRNAWYLRGPEDNHAAVEVWDVVITFFYYFLLLSNVIPISLYVSLSIVKFGQAYFMGEDLAMYHRESDTPTEVRTMALNEELGQVSHIFSDKTGTLTCNIMDFRKCTVGGVSYGKGTTKVGEAAMRVRGVHLSPDDVRANKLAEMRAQPHVSFYDPSLPADLNGASGDAQLENLSSFFLALALCHSVTPEIGADGECKYSASSPDDEALVCAARYFGVRFAHRASGTAIVDRDGAKEAFDVLDLLEFTSARKRMSVIVRDSTGQIRLYSKGADSHMLARLRNNGDAVCERTLAHVNKFAQEGLRTLLVCEKVMSEEEFQSFHDKYERAQLDLAEVEKRKRGVADNAVDSAMSEVEQGLRLLGATAIEDKLQDGVPETIEALLDADIKVWVLTGDKTDTAKNIAVACRLLRPNMTRIEITAEQLERNGLQLEGMDVAAAYAAKRDIIGAAISHWLDEVQSRKEKRPSFHDVAVEDLDSDDDDDDNDDDHDDHNDHGTSINDANDADEGDDDDSADDSDDEKDTGQSTLHATQAGTVILPTDGAGSTNAAFKLLKQRPPTKALGRADFALVIDNVCLSIASDPEIQPLLLELSLECAAVVACRMSPKQKQEIVELVKAGVPNCTSLAIGDGANDVAMIQAAHVGIGVSGQEGMQAVNASDYAIAQFRFLQRLLLVHGRFNYRRVAKLTLYIFYKNILNTACLFWFSFANAFSGQKFFPEGGIQLFNILYTNLPALCLGVFDQDVETESAFRTPTLYTPGINNAYFNNGLFWQWFCEAVFEAAAITYMPLLFIPGDDGELTSLWTYGTMCFITVVVAANAKIFFQQYRWLWFQYVAFAVTLASLFPTLLLYESRLLLWFDWEYHMVFSHTIGNVIFWLAFAGFMVLIIGRDFFAKGYMRAFHPNVYQMVQEVDRKNRSNKVDHKTRTSRLDDLRLNAELRCRHSSTAVFSAEAFSRRVSTSNYSLRPLEQNHAHESGFSPRRSSFSRILDLDPSCVSTNLLRGDDENGFSYSYDPDTVTAEKLRALTGRAREVTANAFWSQENLEDEISDGQSVPEGGLQAV